MEDSRVSSFLSFEVLDRFWSRRPPTPSAEDSEPALMSRAD